MTEITMALCTGLALGMLGGIILGVVVRLWKEGQ